MRTPRFPRLVVATRNMGKLVELADGLAGFAPPIVLSPLSDWSGAREVDETGDTCRENARLKAVSALEATGLPSLADDTALEVDALGGAPGVHSARYAGPDGDARANMTKLLEALEGVPPARRTARFRCVLALAEPGGDVSFTEGVVEGHILAERRGSAGFGYDPLFRVDGLDRTMAELTTAEKSLVSHRGRALAALRTLLQRAEAG
ncbi:MAG TPA: RdgB/HAM1 family non-canonical purine NTP pyrophosphatase [Candidatus Eisenbacteria bacterium]